MKTLLVMASIAVHVLAAPLASQEPPNIVLIVADDLGIEHLEAYDIGTSANRPATPTLDSLASGGRLFRFAWSNPVCSPTRATLQTGLFGFQNGIGNVVNDRSFPFPAFYVADLSLADVLRRETAYATGAFGKWHLGMSNDPTVGGSSNPNFQGYDQFTGTRANLDADPGGYSEFQWIENGNCDPMLPPEARGGCPLETTYATTKVTEWTLDWLATLGAPGIAPPWFAYVAYQAPHTPIHYPPAALTEIPLCPDGGDDAAPFCCSLDAIDAGSDPLPCYFAMIEAMDAEIGNLIAGIESLGFGDDTIYIFVGDNGTRSENLGAPYPAGHGKGTLYNGGIQVPLIMSGPTIEPGEVTGLVNTTDLFATVLDLAGVDPAVFEQRRPFSISTVPYLRDPQPAESLRPIVFAELFQARRTVPPTPVDGAPPYRKLNQAISDGAFKLLQRGEENQRLIEELYDLVADPFETFDLLTGEITPEIEAERQALRQRLEQLTGCPTPRIVGSDCQDP